MRAARADGEDEGWLLAAVLARPVGGVGRVASLVGFAGKFAAEISTPLGRETLPVSLARIGVDAPVAGRVSLVEEVWEACGAKGVGDSGRWERAIEEAGCAGSTGAVSAAGAGGTAIETGRAQTGLGNANGAAEGGCGAA